MVDWNENCIVHCIQDYVTCSLHFKSVVPVSNKLILLWNNILLCPYRWHFHYFVVHIKMTIPKLLFCSIFTSPLTVHHSNIHESKTDQQFQQLHLQIENNAQSKFPIIYPNKTIGTVNWCNPNFIPTFHTTKKQANHHPQFRWWWYKLIFFSKIRKRPKWPRPRSHACMHVCVCVASTGGALGHAPRGRGMRSACDILEGAGRRLCTMRTAEFSIVLGVSVGCGRMVFSVCLSAAALASCSIVDVRLEKGWGWWTRHSSVCVCK